MDNTYKHFFDIDESFYPCFDSSAIEAKDTDWKDTYPHKTFIELLKLTEEMLSGITKKSLWIHGAYGTGKSRCAYALKKILDVSDDELKEYWNKYPDLKDKNKDLLTKFIGHKDGNILTVWRYASGMVENSGRLFRYIQESIKKSLIENNCEYLGQKTFKDIIISWFSDKNNKDYFNNKLIDFRNDTEELRKHGESFRLFCNKNVDEILNQLQNSDEINELVENIIKLSDKIGINFSTNLDSDSIKKWIEDVIKVNNIKIVFIWDEFSDYFEKNKNSLGDFQDVVSLCQKVPFYFVIITHRTEELNKKLGDTSWKKIQDRFDKKEIILPDNIAFNLIGHAFTVNKSNKKYWEDAVKALNARICDSREEVKKAIKESSDEVIKNIMPIHPMTALVLKHISSVFKSNQRSMFDFIKTRNTDTTKAFQWFIENHGPLDYKPFLTVDMLWNFFYEKGKSDLDQNTRMVLESYPTNENFTSEEEAVLKSILIMQAIDKRIKGEVDVLKTTAQNLKYVFEGTEEFIENPVNIAEKLVKRGILTKKTYNKKEIYVMSELGNFQDIQDKKEIIRKKKTIELVKQGELENALQLPPSLRLRLESEPATGKLIPLTVDNFANETAKAFNKEPSKWHFETFVAFAKNEDEALQLRDKIRNFLQEKKDRDDFIIIDASLTPLGEEEFENYVEFAAQSLVYSGYNNNYAKENENKAKQVLSSEWKSEIFNGQFVVYSKSNLDGKKIENRKSLLSKLQDIILAKYRYIFDFEQGLSESIFKTGNLKASAEGGLKLPKETKGNFAGIEKKVLPNVWNVPNYWENVTTENENISIIKRKLDNKIKEEFDSNGKISIRDIVDFLESEFSFAPSSLYAFLTGFLLKEYAIDSYIYLDEKSLSDVITPEKISIMISDYINNKYQLNKKESYFETYISKLTDDLREFYDLTSYICDFGKKYVTINESQNCMQKKIKEFSLPIWGLYYLGETDSYSVLKLYMDFLKSEGDIAYKIASQIGEKSIKNKSLRENLKSLLIAENFENGITAYITQNLLDGKKFNELVKSLDLTKKEYIDDIKSIFDVKYSNLWEEKGTQEEIKKLMFNYEFIKNTNFVLDTKVKTLKDAFQKWNERLDFVYYSKEFFKNSCSEFSAIFDFLFDIYTEKNQANYMPNNIKNINTRLRDNLGKLKMIFEKETTREAVSKYYRKYCADFSDEIFDDFPIELLQGKRLFAKNETEVRNIVRDVLEDCQKGQENRELFEYWKAKTDTRDPREWSSIHRTPILIMLNEDEYSRGEQVFELINKKVNVMQYDLDNALDFLKNNDELFERLDNKDEINKRFAKFLGKYSVVLKDFEDVRKQLESTKIETYNWVKENPIAKKLKSIAENKYKSCRDNVIEKIKVMNEESLRKYLIKMIENNMDFGIEIMSEEE